MIWKLTASPAPPSVQKHRVDDNEYDNEDDSGEAADLEESRPSIRKRLDLSGTKLVTYAHFVNHNNSLKLLEFIKFFNSLSILS